jgi:hypothetical protein
MSLRFFLIAPVALALLAGCDRQPEAAAPTAARFDAPAPGTPQSAPANHPEPAPSVSAPENLAGAAPPVAVAAPDAVLRQWGRAIEARDWARVRALWGHGGADSGLSATAFASRWRTLRHPRVTVGPGDQEGAAGSTYYTAPIRVEDGTRTIAGAITIRRVNDVPGATAEQLRWHLDATTRAPWTDPRG